MRPLPVIHYIVTLHAGPPIANGQHQRRAEAIESKKQRDLRLRCLPLSDGVPCGNHAMLKHFKPFLCFFLAENSQPLNYFPAKFHAT